MPAQHVSIGAIRPCFEMKEMVGSFFQLQELTVRGVDTMKVHSILAPFSKLITSCFPFLRALEHQDFDLTKYMDLIVGTVSGGLMSLDSPFSDLKQCQ